MVRIEEVVKRSSTSGFEQLYIRADLGFGKGELFFE